jgi:hypothetical protein
MGMLRDRREGDLKLSGLSESTQETYLNCARRFAEHHGRSPAEMGEQEIKDFLVHLIKEKRASPATHRMYVASLRFLYRVTLKRPECVAAIPYPKVPRTRSETNRLIQCITSITSRAIAAVMYGSRLRSLQRLREPAELVQGAHV